MHFKTQIEVNISKIVHIKIYYYAYQKPIPQHILLDIKLDGKVTKEVMAEYYALVYETDCDHDLVTKEQ